MLISLKELKNKYNLNLNNILHVGAHEADELSIYVECGAQKIHWIEANEELCEKMKSKVDLSFNKITNAVVADIDNKEVSFNISNSSQSSSILELGDHKFLFPGIDYIKREKRYTTTLDTILLDTNLSCIDFLNIDIQGAELLALKGCQKNLGNISSVYLEINETEVYQNCGLIGEIDSFLETFNFKRVEKAMWENHPWGDAFYIKNK